MSERPVPRRRAEPAPDEAAGATPISPAAPQHEPRRTEQVRAAGGRDRAVMTPRRQTFAQLNVRLTSEEMALFEEIQLHDGTKQVEAARTIITEAARNRGLL